jgi:hypothetical protein
VLRLSNSCGCRFGNGCIGTLIAVEVDNFTYLTVTSCIQIGLYIAGGVRCVWVVDSLIVALQSILSAIHEMGIWLAGCAGGVRACLAARLMVVQLVQIETFK